MQIKKLLKLVALAGMLMLLGGCATGDSVKDNRIFISAEEFLTYCEESVELTTENWQEYFEVVRGKKTEEITSTSRRTQQYDVLALKSGCFLVSDTVQLSVTGTTSRNSVYTFLNVDRVEEETETVNFKREIVLGETPLQADLYLVSDDSDAMIVYIPETEDGSIPTELDTDALCYWKYTAELVSMECTAASGKVSKIAIPEHLWNIEEEGVRYLCVGTAEDFFRIYELTFQDDYRRFLEKLEE